jgi:nitrogen fixation protein FixH
MVILLIFGGVIAFFIYTSNLDINLVENNYYEKELIYEQKIEKTRNAINLTGKISIEPGSDFIVIHFPDTVRHSGIEGTILFYRPSDENKDFTVPIALDDSLRQVIGKENMLPGKYIVKIEWEMEGVHYYHEQVLINQ